MSRARLRHRRGSLGLAFAVVVFALGMTAAVALGWENEQKPKDHGKNEQEQGKEHGNKENEKNDQHGNKEKGNQQPKGQTTPTTPQAPTTTTPTQTVPAPPAAVPTPSQPTPSQAPSAPVNAQGAPEQPSGEQPSGRGGKEVAQAPTPSAPLAPVAEQQKLARTGLDPAWIALMGVLCLGGGAFLFRRAMAR